MVRYKLFLCLFLWFLASSAHAQLSYNLIFDSKQSEVFGAENIVTTHAFIYKGLDRLIPTKFNDESTFLTKTTGTGYRLLKLLFLDFQIDFMFALSQHEVFGHGSRYREFGYDDISFELSPFFPYGSGSGLASWKRPPDYSVTKSQRLANHFSGNEGNLVLSRNLEERMLLAEEIHYREGLLFLMSRNNLLQYSSRTYLADGDGDIRSYVTGINQGGPFLYDEKKLFYQNLIVLLNPMQLYTLLAIGNNYLFKGEHKMKTIPMISFNEVKYLPSLNFNLTPFGAEFLFNNYLKKNNKLLNVQFRLGDASFHTFYGIGAKLMNAFERDNLKLHIKADLWHQPEFSLGGRSIRTVEEGLGYFTSISCAWYPIRTMTNLGFYGHLGYKSDGYIMGEMLERGPVIRFGISLKQLPWTVD